MRIGVAGIGRMGEAIAGRLLSVGQEVGVWNRTTAKARALATAGAEVAATPAQLSSDADVVLTTLTDARAVDEVYHGPDGLLASEVTGRLFVEMSTIRPQMVRSLAAEAARRGAALVDCPVSGSVDPARDGRLLGLVGGDADDVALARPVLDLLCRRLEHVGPIGSGASLKLAVQLPAHVYWQVLGEALTLCQGLHIEVTEVLDLLADTPGAPGLLRTRRDVIASVLDGEPVSEVSFDVDAVRKDLRAMVEEADALGRALPVTQQVLECFDHAAADGLGREIAPTVTRRWLQSPSSGRSPGCA